MIKSIELKNFKTHKDSIFEFDRHINVITAMPNNGKSNVLRAFKLATYNRPSGIRFASDFADKKAKTSITIETDRGNVEIWKKKKYKKDGTRILDTDGCIVNSQKFEVLNKNIPEQVLEVLNLTDINFQEQDDPDYLISENPGEIAKRFDEITGLDKIDESLKRLNSDLRELNTKQSILKQDVKKINEDLEKYDGYESIESIIEDAENTEKEKSLIDNRLQTIYGLSLNYKICEDFILKNKPILLQQKDYISRFKQYEKEINEINQKIDLLNQYSLSLITIEKFQSVFVYKDCLAELKKLNSDIDSVKSKIKSINDYNRLVLEVEKLLKIKCVRKNLDRLIKLNERISELNTKIDGIKKYITIANGNFEIEYNELNRLKKERDKINICPKCGYKLGE